MSMRTLGLLATLLLAAPLGAQAPDTTLSRARALAEAGAWAQAADLYQQALATRPADPALLGEAIDALEACGRWRDAIPLLDRFLAESPGEARRQFQRGLFGAWAGDRDAGLSHLRRAVDRAPRNAEFLAGLGEVLSWRPADRAEAAQVIAQALALDPGNVRAQVVAANLLAWTGRPAAALPGYEAILAEHPTLVAALAGKSGALEQLGRHQAAREALVAARTLAPDDGYLTARLARLELALGRPRAAASLLDGLEAAEAPEFRPVRDSVRRALRPYIELQGAAVARERQLDRRGAELAVVFAPHDALRVRLGAQPLEYRDGIAAVRRGGQYGGGLAWSSGSAVISARVGYRDLGAATTATWVGGADAAWTAARGVRLEGKWQRLPVEESRRSAFGSFADGRGPVLADLATVGLVLDRLPAGIVLRADLLAGSHGGTGWARNDRLGASGEMTVGLRAAGPHLRVGYAARMESFAFSADTVQASVPERAGGYFSPDRYLLHQAVLQASHRLGGRLGWMLDARVGGESVRMAAGEASSRRTAVVVNAAVQARLTGQLDLEVAYLYLDAFDAFRMHQVRAGIRQFF